MLGLKESCIDPGLINGFSLYGIIGHRTLSKLLYVKGTLNLQAAMILNE